MSEARYAIKVIINGRVQGVGFRSWCLREASRLELSGWVRNLRSGQVEAFFSGPEVAVAQMLGLCQRGPHWARVDDVALDHNVAPVSGPFQVKSTV